MPNRSASPATAAFDAALAALVNADHDDPFGFLGMHFDSPVDAPEIERPGGSIVVRAFLPGARIVQVLECPSGGGAGKVVATLARIHSDGVFAGPVLGRDKSFPYRLRVEFDGDTDGEMIEFEDAYRFLPVLGELDTYLLAEGNHLRAYERLGAHLREIDGVAGTAFAVWAPNARRVSVVGDFCDWDGRRLPMRKLHDCGVWEIFVPGVGPGERYKFEIKAAGGALLPLKSDPCALAAEHPPRTASVVASPDHYQWHDGDWLARRVGANRHHAPISIYEVHLGSWRRVPEEGGRPLSYRELAVQLVSYVVDMGFTHIELLPITEFPFDGSWGYQPIGLYAPTSRHGQPDDFRALVDACHQAEIGVLLDWVPGHFPTDPHGLGCFDGSHLYEHADPRQGFQPDWNTLVYNFGRREVANFLLGSALFWLDRYHLDGIRVDAVASMLYLDYSRKDEEWIPNRYGGKENLEAVEFLRRLNKLCYAHHPGVMTVAEESTAWPGVSRPTWLGGLGFGFKWNMGWMHDTLAYFGHDPIHRPYHHHDLTFALLYQYTENFLLPISHDEVVHGKGSLLSRMPGDCWQQFANLRAFLGYMFCHPGKKLLFMGCEFGQGAEWNHNASLDWHLLDRPHHCGISDLVRDLNRLYRETPALYQGDCDPGGFEWIEANDHTNSVVAFLRRSPHGEGQAVLCVGNFTPMPRYGYRVGVPAPGWYVERLNTDAECYGGSNMGNSGGLEAEDRPWHGKPWSLALTLPPLAVLVLELRK
ncbi:MAG: 1,4-alpha-glucan branching protein GlgB [Rhodospirillaceae bacterium]